MYVSQQVGFGTSRLHRIRTKVQQCELLHGVLNLGVKYFDTAPIYGDGCAERAIGRIIPFVQDRSTISIATKFGLKKVIIQSTFIGGARKMFYVLRRVLGIKKNQYSIRDYSESALNYSLYDSLARMKLNYVDILHFHEPRAEDVKQILQTSLIVPSLKSNNLIKYIGYAGSAQTILQFNKVMKNCFDIVQIEDTYTTNACEILKKNGIKVNNIYGMLRTNKEKFKLTELLSEAYRRLPNGIFLFSSVSIAHIKEFIATHNEIKNG